MWHGWNLSLFGQVILAVLLAMYIWQFLNKSLSGGTAVNMETNSKREMEKLRKMRAISLTLPLTEKVRPKNFAELIGQEDGLKALRAALCGKNPQHVIIYGPPGIGKTAAARLVLAEAKKSYGTPFCSDAKLIEIDGSTSRFDERGIADPLIGSVHDPIYQGSGPMGQAGIPQPKPGAVTKAHGGILFIDEIGELHPIQINKLLKVLEDRRVILESAYYNPDNTNIPQHIHDVFQNGLPADFRLIAATTRMPEEIPAAIRSRCVEIYFRALLPEQIVQIAENAALNLGVPLKKDALQLLAQYAASGREAVNMVQIASSVAKQSRAASIDRATVEWVINCGQYNPRFDKKVPALPAVGAVNGLAVIGPNQGALLELEASSQKVKPGRGKLTVTGVVEQEETNTGQGHKMLRQSMVKSSVENVMTVLKKNFDLELDSYDIHINFPGSMPVDGPSAGVGIAVAIYSSVHNIEVDNRTAFSGELSIRGEIKPVGGILAKVEAARLAGANKVLIPKDNWLDAFDSFSGCQIIPVSYLEEVFREVFEPAVKKDIADSLLFPLAQDLGQGGLTF